MKNSRVRNLAPMVISLVAMLAIAILISCGGATQNSSATKTGPVSTFITDPPTCGVNSGGPYSHVYVTITRVRAHLSSNAGPDDSGWIDLVDLRNSPKQIDLLSLESTTCVLTQLGSTTGLVPGKYQQIRFHLLSNNPGQGEATPSPNACGNNGFNCVQVQSGGISTLQLSSEVQTGIKIPPGQIAGGGINLEAGQSADLNIDFDTCASIVMSGANSYRLKPTLRAGEVSLNQNSIGGTVVDGSTNTLLPGALVLLEQPETLATPPAGLPAVPIDRVIRATVTGSDGSFIFCPLPAGDNSGKFDVVVSAMTTSPLLVTTTYNATIVFGVPIGASVANIPLLPEPGGVGGSSSPGTVSGQVTSAGAAIAAVADVTLSALQQATPAGGSMLEVTIPVFAALSQPPIVTTAADQACPAGTDCVTYNLQVPASNPNVGTFSNGTVTYTPPAAGSVNVDLAAEAPACTSGSLGATVAVTPGATTNVSNAFAFTGCQ